MKEKNKRARNVRGRDVEAVDRYLPTYVPTYLPADVPIVQRMQYFTFISPSWHWSALQRDFNFPEDVQNFFNFRLINVLSSKYLTRVWSSYSFIHSKNYSVSKKVLCEELFKVKHIANVAKFKKFQMV